MEASHRKWCVCILSSVCVRARAGVCVCARARCVRACVLACMRVVFVLHVCQEKQKGRRRYHPQKLRYSPHTILRAYRHLRASQRPGRHTPTVIQLLSWETGERSTSKAHTHTHSARTCSETNARSHTHTQARSQPLFGRIPGVRRGRGKRAQASHGRFFQMNAILGKSAKGSSSASSSTSLDLTGARLSTCSPFPQNSRAGAAASRLWRVRHK